MAGTNFLPVGEDLSSAANRLAQRLRAGAALVLNGAGAGSGTAWGANNLVVTNNHVVPAGNARVVVGESVFEARVAARDPGADLALLVCEPTLLTPLSIRSGALRPGELVYAIGNPWGERDVLTAGTLLSASTGARSDGRIVPVRAQLRLAPGNSGGPMTDATGRVIGINSMVMGGLAVAIPSSVVERFVAAAGVASPAAA